MSVQVMGEGGGWFNLLWGNPAGTLLLFGSGPGTPWECHHDGAAVLEVKRFLATVCDPERWR